MGPTVFVGAHVAIAKTLLLLTASGSLGFSASHCRPVSSSTADSSMPSTSARDWLLPASTMGAICGMQERAAGLGKGCVKQQQLEYVNKLPGHRGCVKETQGLCERDRNCGQLSRNPTVQKCQSPAHKEAWLTFQLLAVLWRIKRDQCLQQLCALCNGTGGWWAASTSRRGVVVLVQLLPDAFSAAEAAASLHRCLPPTVLC